MCVTLSAKLVEGFGQNKHCPGVKMCVMALLEELVDSFGDVVVLMVVVMVSELERRLIVVAVAVAVVIVPMLIGCWLSRLRVVVGSA